VTPVPPPNLLKFSSRGLATAKAGCSGAADKVLLSYRIKHLRLKHRVVKYHRFKRSPPHRTSDTGVRRAPYVFEAITPKLRVGLRQPDNSVFLEWKLETLRLDPHPLLVCSTQHPYLQQNILFPNSQHPRNSILAITLYLITYGRFCQSHIQDNQSTAVAVYSSATSRSPTSST
jgi:hypothetical protein